LNLQPGACEAPDLARLLVNQKLERRIAGGVQRAASEASFARSAATFRRNVSLKLQVAPVATEQDLAQIDRAANALLQRCQNGHLIAWPRFHSPDYREFIACVTSSAGRRVNQSELLRGELR
jgi:hypothetical protein